MFFQQLSKSDINLFRTINSSLYIVNIILTILIILYLLFRLHSKKEEIKKKGEKTLLLNLITWAIFFILICIGHILKLITTFYIQRGQIPEIIAKLLGKIMVAIAYSAFIIKILYMEYVINKENYYKGYYFSVMITVVTIIILFVDIENIMEIGILHYIVLILLCVGYSILPLLYFFLTLKTVGKSRINAFKISAGLVFLGLGLLINPDNLIGYMGVSELLDTLIAYTYITSSISLILSSILIFAGIWEK